MPSTHYPKPPPLRTADVNSALMVSLRLDDSRVHPVTGNPLDVDCFGALDAPSQLPAGSCLSARGLMHAWQREVAR